MDKLKRKDLLYPELSYKIVGMLFKIYNELGYGYQEKFYEKALENELIEEKIDYKRQLHVPVKFNNKKIGDYFLDFLI